METCLCAGKGVAHHGTFRAAVECKDKQITALQAQLTDREERLALWRGIKKTIDVSKLRINPYVFEQLKDKGEI